MEVAILSQMKWDFLNFEGENNWISWSSIWSWNPLFILVSVVSLVFELINYLLRTLRWNVACELELVDLVVLRVVGIFLQITANSMELFFSGCYRYGCNNGPTSWNHVESPWCKYFQNLRQKCPPHSVFEQSNVPIGVHRNLCQLVQTKSLTKFVPVLIFIVTVCRTTFGQPRINVLTFTWNTEWEHMSGLFERLKGFSALLDTATVYMFMSFHFWHPFLQDPVFPWLSENLNLVKGLCEKHPVMQSWDHKWSPQYLVVQRWNFAQEWVFRSFWELKGSPFGKQQNCGNISGKQVCIHSVMPNSQRNPTFWLKAGFAKEKYRGQSGGLVNLCCYIYLPWPPPKYCHGLP